jgi:hypothetical protein
MATIKQLIKRLNQKTQYLAVWEEIKAFLEEYSGEDESKSIQMSDGGFVDKKIINRVLGEIDSDIVSYLEDEIKNIENIEVDDGDDGRKKKKKK